ncbi:hypothetical protein NDR87_27415 [Nocardia sp. CDC159]|uniref:Uncharacterized protein n=1 Tax=Nocardia pulmonis TaxID=2951408 RepID=A0A9X2EFE8_9NOCA|nr:MULTISPECIES: hypothetical protein [Nocardia]MCM6777223.1 hypothetical protein [Nocardia pulmonis]MCM6790108.1 hypothetical protein [Nocardia sp. CDC159]
MTVEAVAVGPSVSPVAGTLRFRDAQTGSTFHIGSPARRPELWDRYLDGALRAYRHYGVESVLDWKNTRDGKSTALFFAGVNAVGEVVAGVRAQWPCNGVNEIAALREWRGRAGESALRDSIAERMPFGVVEVRGGWVDRSAEDRRALGAAVARCIAYAPMLLGKRFAFGTAASFTADRYSRAGGVIPPEIPSVPFPDTRYRTVPVWWDSWRYREVVGGQQYSLMSAELRELGITDHKGGRSRRESGRGWEVLRTHGR